MAKSLLVLLFLFFFFQCLLVPVSSEEDNGGLVIEVESKEHLDQIKKENDFVLVAYHVDFCIVTSRILDNMKTVARQLGEEYKPGKILFVSVDVYFLPEIEKEENVRGKPEVRLYKKESGSSVVFEWDPTVDDFLYFLDIQAFHRIKHYKDYDEWKNATDHLDYRAVFIGNLEEDAEYREAFVDLVYKYPLYTFMSLEPNEKIYRLIKRKLSEEPFVDVDAKNLTIITEAVKEFYKIKKEHEEIGDFYSEIKVEALDVPASRKSPTYFPLKELSPALESLRTYSIKNKDGIHVVLFRPEEIFKQNEVSASLATDLFFRNTSAAPRAESFATELQSFFERKHKPFTLSAFSQRIKSYVMMYNLTVVCAFYRDKVIGEEKYFGFYKDSMVDLVNRTYYNFLFNYIFDYKVSDFDSLIFYPTDIVTTETDRRLAYYLGVDDSQLPKLMAFRFNHTTQSLDKYAFQTKSIYYGTNDLWKFHRDIVGDPKTSRFKVTGNSNSLKYKPAADDTRVVSLNPLSLEKIIKTQKSLSKEYGCVVVEYCTEYCGYCKRLRAALNKLSRDKNHQKTWTKGVYMGRIDVEVYSIENKPVDVPTVRAYCHKDPNVYHEFEFQSYSEEEVRTKLEEFYKTAFEKSEL